jgi:hypothetical protein
MPTTRRTGRTRLVQPHGLLTLAARGTSRSPWCWATRLDAVLFGYGTRLPTPERAMRLKDLTNTPNGVSAADRLNAYRVALDPRY